jgi:hypothetical protein
MHVQSCRVSQMDWWSCWRLAEADGALDKTRRHKKRQLEDTLHLVMKKRKVGSFFGWHLDITVLGKEKNCASSRAFAQVYVPVDFLMPSAWNALGIHTMWTQSVMCMECCPAAIAILSILQLVRVTSTCIYLSLSLARWLFRSMKTRCGRRERSLLCLGRISWLSSPLFWSWWNTAFVYVLVCGFSC